MTQSSESFGPNNPDTRQTSNPPNVPSFDSLNLSPSNTTSELRFKALLAIIQRHNESVIPRPRSAQFTELRQALNQLAQCELYIDGMGAICKILERNIDTTTLLTALELVNQFYRLNPQRKDSGQFKKLLVKHVVNNTIDSLAQVCAQIIPIYQTTNNSRGLTYTLERSSTVLSRSALSGIAQEKLIELMGLVVARTGSLRGIQSIRKALSKACSTEEVGFLASTITAAILNGEKPRAAALALGKVPSYIALEPLAGQVLEKAITAHKKSGGITSTIVESFTEIFSTYDRDELEAGLERYGQLVELLEPYRAPLHLLRQQDIDTLIATNPSEYAMRVALRLREIERLTELAHSSGKFEPTQISALQEILVYNSSVEVFRAFELILTQGIRLIEHPESLLAKIEYFGSDL